MTVTDQIKSLHKKMKQNEAQYDLDRKAAEISPSSSKDLVDKYEYLTGKNLGIKPSTTQQAKFEYSSLGKVFTKGLNKDNQKDGLFKRLSNIEGKNEEQLKAIEYHGENQSKAIEDLKGKQLEIVKTSRLKSIKPDDYAKGKEGTETINYKFIEFDNSIDYAERLYVSGDKKVFNFFAFKSMFELFQGLAHDCIKFNDAELEQVKFVIELERLKNKTARGDKYM